VHCFEAQVGGRQHWAGRQHRIAQLEERIASMPEARVQVNTDLAQSSKRIGKYDHSCASLR
jgi:hypothetical protein